MTLDPVIRTSAETEEVRVLTVLNSGNFPAHIDLYDLGMQHMGFGFKAIKTMAFYQDLALFILLQDFLLGRFLLRVRVLIILM
jgi:hypothetical protein